jgi:hypothetical protein
MRKSHFFAACAGLLFLGVIPNFGGTDEDSYSAREVAEVLKMPSGFSSGISEKIVERLGDRVSIALLKIYTEDELTDANTFRRFLPLIEDAFRFRDLISIPEDRRPRVTVIFLEFLQMRTANAALKSDIMKTEGVVRSLTSH